uniref:Uncharacterized protein n=1 Tax=Salarias fasciatus TaxID=181472 RepID=A0A672HFG6_SALFA
HEVAGAQGVTVPPSQCAPPGAQQGNHPRQRGADSDGKRTQARDCTGLVCCAPSEHRTQARDWCAALPRSTGLRHGTGVLRSLGAQDSGTGLVCCAPSGSHKQEQDGSGLHAGSKQEQDGSGLHAGSKQEQDGSGLHAGSKQEQDGSGLHAGSKQEQDGSGLHAGSKQEQDGSGLHAGSKQEQDGSGLHAGTRSGGELLSPAGSHWHTVQGRAASPAHAQWARASFTGASSLASTPPRGARASFTRAGGAIGTKSGGEQLRQWPEADDPGQVEHRHRQVEGLLPAGSRSGRLLLSRCEVEGPRCRQQAQLKRVFYFQKTQEHRNKRQNGAEVQAGTRTHTDRPTRSRQDTPGAWNLNTGQGR